MFFGYSCILLSDVPAPGDDLAVGLGGCVDEKFPTVNLRFKDVKEV